MQISGISRSFNLRGFLKRRKYLLMLPFTILLGATVAVAFLLPKIYYSSAKILVEDRKVPEQIVGDNFNYFINRRLDMINQKIMSRDTLWGLIERYRLYEESWEDGTKEGIIETFKDDIEFTASETEVKLQSGNLIEATLWFEINYKYTDPKKTKQIVDELVQMYIMQNNVDKRERFGTTLTFLVDERDVLEKQIEQLEEKIAIFKKTHLKEMPERLDFNIQMMNDLESEISSLETELKANQEKKSETEGRLRKTTPFSRMIEPTGERVIGPAEQLEALQFEYINKQATLSKQHPDMVSMRRQINELKTIVSTKNQITDLEKKLSNLNTTYQQKKASLSDLHPDMKAIVREIAKTEKQLDRLQSNVVQEKRTVSRKADNPAYIDLETDLEMITIDYKSSLAKLRGLRGKYAVYEERVRNTPDIERAYLKLTRQYDLLKEKYGELQEKIQQTDEARKAESEERGTKFIVIDTPQLPAKPSEPMVPVIIALGLVVSLSIAASLAYLSEMTDQTIRVASEVKRIIGQPVLVSVPYFNKRKDRVKAVMLRIFDILWMLAFMCGMVWAVYYYYINYYLPETRL